MLFKKRKEKKLRQLACMAQGDMNNYERKQLEFETD